LTLAVLQILNPPSSNANRKKSGTELAKAFQSPRDIQYSHRMEIDLTDFSASQKQAF
jgi:hypothetical protein